MVAHYILLREHLVERRGGTFSTRGKTHQSQAIEGSLWYAPPGASLPRTHGTIVLRSHEFEEDVLECLLGHVERLTEFQVQLLSAVKSCKDRIKLFNDKRWLSEIERINVGCIVFLVNTSEVPEKTPAKVQYIGELPSQAGVWFGVELSRQHHGRGRSNGTFKGISFFKCPLDAGLFVPANNLQICPTPSLFQETTAPPTRGFTTYEVPAAETHGSEHMYTNVPPPEYPPLSIGERVVWISDTGPELGVVKWIGILPDSRLQEYTIGLEFDKPIGTGTGKYNNLQLFRARQNHASLVPVLGLMKASEYFGDDVPPPPDFPAMAPLPSPLSPSSPYANTFPASSPSVYEDFSSSASTKNTQKPTQDRFAVESPSDVLDATDLPTPHSDPWRDNASTLSSNMSDLHLAPDPTYCEVSHSSRTLPPSSSRVANGRSNHVRTGSHGNSLATTEAADPQLVTVVPSAVGSEFELGLMVEVINGPPECRYGVIRWMGHPKTEPSKLIAGLEMEEESSAFTDGRFGNERCFTCPSNKAFFVFTHKLKRDSRFDESASFIERRDSQAFGAMACPDLEGDIPPPSANDLDRFLGQNKGIQGHHNSCYMDAMLFSMYSFSMVFDSILFRPKRSDDIKDYDKVQKVLRDSIVNPLRSNFFVRADKVLNLRKLLDKCSSVKGLMTEEKDPEEFLKSLLQETLKADPFIKLSSGQECFHYQLFMEKEESIVLPTTQQLLELSFLQSDIKLAKTPPCLILQMPRFGKTFKMYSRIVPSLRLDITDIMLSYPRECTICGRLASHECQACYQHFGDSLDKIAFCANCLKKSHSHSKRTNHSPRPLQIDPDYLQYYESHPDASIAREVLELFAVICIATSHYVTFVKCGKGDDAPWVFFDSMADRMGTKHGYNVPEVQQCHFLPEWLKDEQRKKICQISDDKQLPEQMRRLLCDSYICMYQSPSLVHYQ